VSDSTSNNESITEVVPKVLGEYLLNNVSGLREFYDEWPNASIKLKMPSVSIISTRMDFRPTSVPYKDKDIQPAEIVANKAKVLWVVGDYDITIQLDIWAGSKEERDDMFDATFNALNPRINPMGITLKMDEYFGSLCDYLYVGHSFSDSEDRSQRDEWRASLSLLATCKAIRDRKEFIITDRATAPEIEAISQIDTTVVVTE
jgi:hypothetical protein